MIGTEDLNSMMKKTSVNPKGKTPVNTTGKSSVNPQKTKAQKAQKPTLDTLNAGPEALIQSFLAITDVAKMGKVNHTLNRKMKQFIALSKNQERLRQEIEKNPKFNPILREFFASPRVTYLVKTGQLRVEDELPYLNVLTLFRMDNLKLALIAKGCTVREIRSAFINEHHARVLLNIEEIIRGEVENEFRLRQTKLEEELKKDCDFQRENQDPEKEAQEQQIKRNKMESELFAEKTKLLAMRFDGHFQKIRYMSAHDVLKHYKDYASPSSAPNKTEQIAAENKRLKEERLQPWLERKELTELQKMGLAIGFTLKEVTTIDGSIFTKRHYSLARSGFLPKEVCGLNPKELKLISYGLKREELHLFPKPSATFTCFLNRIPMVDLLDLPFFHQAYIVSKGLPVSLARNLSNDFLIQDMDHHFIDNIVEMYNRIKQEIRVKYEGRKYKVDINKKIEEAFFKYIGELRRKIAREERKKQEQSESENNLQKISKARTLTFQAPSAISSNRTNSTLRAPNDVPRTLPRQASKVQSNPSKKPGCAKRPTG